ncbi:MAG: hypothetical protein JO044_12750 [Mycobacteriaceae bacterium]|nr:hypothetical protein [Mycobacteriaceae bacterium]
MISAAVRAPLLAAHPLGTAAAGFAAYTLVMLVFERRMRRSGGPGIVPFQLAGSAERAQRIMTRWGDDGQRAARWSLRLDFGYMLTYGWLTALLVDRARRRWGHPRVLALAVVPAVAADAVEGVSLLKVLGSCDIAVNASRARAAARVKYLVLVAALLYAVSGLSTAWERR